MPGSKKWSRVFSPQFVFVLSVVEKEVCTSVLHFCLCKQTWDRLLILPYIQQGKTLRYSWPWNHFQLQSSSTRPRLHNIKEWGPVALVKLHARHLPWAHASSRVGSVPWEPGSYGLLYWPPLPFGFMMCLLNEKCQLEIWREAGNRVVWAFICLLSFLLF